MNTYDQIRSALAKCERMTMDQLADANDWDSETRRKAYIKIAQMKSKGEISSNVEDGKVGYSLIPTYVKGTGGRKPGPQIHVGRADKSPKPAAALPVAAQRASSNTKAVTALLSDVLRAAEKPAPVVHPMQRESDQLTGRTRSDFDLGTRIDVVVEDIQALLTDALDADHGRELVKQLVAANHALNRAARLYPRK